MEEVKRVSTDEYRSIVDSLSEITEITEITANTSNSRLLAIRPPRLKKRPDRAFFKLKLLKLRVPKIARSYLDLSLEKGQTIEPFGFFIIPECGPVTKTKKAVLKITF